MRRLCHERNFGAVASSVCMGLEGRSGQQQDVKHRDRRRSGVGAAVRVKDQFCCSRGGESEFDRNSPNSGLSQSNGGLLLMVQGSWMGFKLVVAEIKEKNMEFELRKDFMPK
ncbi:hypothetical protein CXB51_034718 [Gossypium anomalum]|uniref:Uncharacterized protein n=1 Tax=Gossypium anomalum TaxID=47600 RepID=A0A8J6CJ39_9ROSI|nr:hypothetical protein CXB51_034718 [Gossypium anomalum]